MQVGGVVVTPDKRVPARLKDKVRRNEPLGGLFQVVRNVIAVEVDGKGAIVVQFHPIGFIAIIGVGIDGGVGGQDFIDPDGGIEHNGQQQEQGR
ncbi:MAG: hypothetical protein BWY72_01537 [Bacteroidetes bacterium ADurb.Bin416]|nr:MAG: hypothetical protein BWY72_01537 [Bacteroidetes bacterium ADurb.Bin416]